MNKYFLYIRKSTDEDDRQVLSLDAQETELRELAEKEKLTIVDTFRESQTAKEPGRAIFNNMLDKIEKGEMDKIDNPLKNSPHTSLEVINTEWNHKYSREVAAFPFEYSKENKYWPAVGRVDDAYGDRNLVCSCAPIQAYTEQ